MAEIAQDIPNDQSEVSKNPSSFSILSQAVSLECVTGEASVWKLGADGGKEVIESDLPEEVARQMVADYAAEGEAVWMERTAPD